MQQRIALIIGATGFVGSKLMEVLSQQEDVSEIRILVRKPLAQLPEKVKQYVTDFTSLTAMEAVFSADVLYCCIGTTRKKTPNLVEYKAIDYGITMDVARLAKSQGCQEIHLVSSVGANSKSSNFYLAIKGEVEQGIQGLGFASCTIYRPSMLIGERNESRPFERLGQVITPLFDFFTFGGKYHSIKAEQVAEAMAKIPKELGLRYLEYKNMLENS